MSKRLICRLAPPSWIGIVGGGQLGRMLTLEAKRMGHHVVVLDPKPNSPAGQVADSQIVAGFSDFEALLNLAQKSDVLTYEFEHIDVELLSGLEKRGYHVYPSAATLMAIQNKHVQKGILKQLNIPVPVFKRIDSLETLKAFFFEMGRKIVLKSCTGGYDGKGNRIVNSEDQLESAFEDLIGADLMAEEFVDYTMEASILVARNHEGIALYPVAENQHNDSILIKSTIPARLPEVVTEKIQEIASRIVNAFEDYGVFCIEFFVDAYNNVSVNEIAPRPHNTGHYSIEACITSQFEQLVRIITGMPMGSVKLKSPCVMFNILGQVGVIGDYKLKGTETMMALEDCHLHLYGKPDTSHLRKLGHISVLGDTVEIADEKALDAFNHIEIQTQGDNFMSDNETHEKSLPMVGVIMGSESDLEVMKQAAFVLKACGIPFEIKVVSAHRTPDRMVDYSKMAFERGIEVIIAGAGGAAHLPGMVASMTSLPVIGVPVKLKTLDGLDSLLSIVQMPSGVPVATVGINNAKNAGILAARILGIKYPLIRNQLDNYIAKNHDNIICDLEDKFYESEDNV
jgi:5-(carboxyamino)imidazole ribonucleotide synthase